MSKNRVIGDSNSLIWHLSEDLKRFKILTEFACNIFSFIWSEASVKAFPIFPSSLDVEDRLSDLLLF